MIGEHVPQPQPWRDHAACESADPSLFEPRSSLPGPAAAAKRICDGCPVRSDCLEDALQHEGSQPGRYRSGVWGGLSVSERVAVSAQRERAAQERAADDDCDESGAGVWPRRYVPPLRTCARCPREVRGPRARYCEGCALQVKRENDRIAVATRRATARARAS